MKYESIAKLKDCFNEQFTVAELMEISNLPKEVSIFIKNSQREYIYTNHLFLQNLGLNFDDTMLINGLKNDDFYKNKSMLAVYKSHDEQVLDTGSILKVCSSVYPNGLEKPIIMQGKLYPLCSKGTKVDMILGIVYALD